MPEDIRPDLARISATRTAAAAAEAEAGGRTQWLDGHCEQKAEKGEAVESQRISLEN